LNTKIYSTYNSTTQQTNIDSFEILNQNIDIFRSVNDSIMAMNTDTFIKFDVNAYNLKNGNFPLISFSNDSIFISTKLGGVGFQSWEKIIGKKIN
jgi:hypothetical protein